MIKPYMKLLVIAYDLPPLLQPQSIQTGRLLYHLSEDYQLYVVSADDKNAMRDDALYPDLRKKFSAVMEIPRKRASLLLRAAYKLLPPLFKMPDVLLSWHKKAFKEIIYKWGSEKFDAILTFSAPLSTNLLGLWLKRHFGIRWVAFQSDPWVETGPYKAYAGLMKFLNSRMEKEAFEAADTLVFASEELKGLYIKKYPSLKGKTLCVEHSYEPVIYSPIVKKMDRLTLRHIGTVFLIRTPKPLLIAIGELLREGTLGAGDLRLEMVGSADRKNRRIISSLKRKYGLGEVVSFIRPVKYHESLALMQEADVLVVIDADFPGSIFLPSKLIDYIGSGTPILGITPPDGASARVIKRVGGWVAPPGDIEAIKRALLDIFSHYKRGTLYMFKPSEAKEEYSVANNIKKVVNILEGRAP